MNRREFLKINLAAAAAAFTGLPALAHADAPPVSSLWPVINFRLFEGDYTPLPTTTLADMREVEARRGGALITTARRLDGLEAWVTYESPCTQTLYGWFAEWDGRLIAAERFDRSFHVIASDQLTFQVTLT